MNSKDSNLAEFIKLHDQIEAEAYSDMFDAVPKTLVQTLGLQKEIIAGNTLLIAKGIPSPMFNRVIGLGVSELPTQSGIDTIRNCYHSAGINNWWIHVSPNHHRNQLETLLSNQGFTKAERGSWAIFLRDNAPVIPVATDATLDIASTADYPAVAEAICIAFEMPLHLAPWFESVMTGSKWQAVCARINDKIIGGGLLYINGKSAWLGAGGVIPRARRLYAHRAITMRRLQFAIDAGCTSIMIETGDPIGNEPNPSFRNIEAVGFNKIYSRFNYQSPNS